MVKSVNTFPLGRPNSLRAWKITFSVFPDAKVLVILEQEREREKKKTQKNGLLLILFSLIQQSKYLRDDWLREKKKNRSTF